MAVNPSPSVLDEPQIIQRSFDADNDALRVNVITGAITISNPSVGVNGAAIPTSSNQAGGKDDSGNLRPLHVDTSGNLNVITLNSLTPVLQDYVALTYVPSGNGVGEIQTVTFKTGGSSGTQTALLTLVYNSDNKLTSVTKS